MGWRESVRIAALHEVARVQGIESAAQTCVSTLARNSKECGIVMPRPFAVLRLTINCNFVGCSMGKWPGRLPCSAARLQEVRGTRTGFMCADAVAAIAFARRGANRQTSAPLLHPILTLFSAPFMPASQQPP